MQIISLHTLRHRNRSVIPTKYRRFYMREGSPKVVYGLVRNALYRFIIMNLSCLTIKNRSTEERHIHLDNYHTGLEFFGH